MSTPTKKPLQPHYTELDKGKGKTASYQVYRQGFLLKPIRGVRKRLLRYWFVLFEQKELLAFLYFVDEDHYLERKKNEGFIRIDDATSIDVVPEYMGRKNAFCITTPRNKFYLVSESRYELHHWLLALHDAMDGYKQHTLQKKKKQSSSLPSSRPRSSSTSGGGNSIITKTPPSIKPSRPAPRPPPINSQNKKKENEPPNTLEGGGSQPQVSPSHNLPSPTTSPLDVIVAGLLAETNQMHEVEYNMTEEEPMTEEYHHHNNREEEEEERSPPAISEVRFPSSSMPMLNSSKEGTESPQGSSGRNSQENEHQFTTSYEDRNTLPLDGQGYRRQIKKRNSTKGLRSVSPPNLPPPPPPPPENLTQENEEKFLQVMNSLTDFGEELDDIMANEIPKEEPPSTTTITNTTASIKPMPPVRTSSLSPGRKHKVIEHDDEEDSVNTYLDEAFQQEDSQGLSTDDEEEKLSTQIIKPTPTSPGILRRDDSKSSTSSTKRTVMFEEDLSGTNNSSTKRVPPSYEPRIDKETNRPLSVAEAKMKLFGQQETKVARYRRSNNLEDEKIVVPTEQVVSPLSANSNKEQDITQAAPTPSFVEATDQPDQSNNEEKDELVQFIETALQSTSYMETPLPSSQNGAGGNDTRKGFVTMVGGEDDKETPPVINQPVHYTLSASNEEGGEEESNQSDDHPDEQHHSQTINGQQPIWSNGTPPNFNNNSQNPVYRSLV